MKTMNRYAVTYKGKEYTVLADSAINAVEKFSSRKVFGVYWIYSLHGWAISADDYGVEWARAFTQDGEKIFADLKESEV